MGAAMVWLEIDSIFFLLWGGVGLNERTRSQLLELLFFL